MAASSSAGLPFRWARRLLQPFLRLLVDVAQRVLVVDQHQPRQVLVALRLSLQFDGAGVFAQAGKRLALLPQKQADLVGDVRVARRLDAIR